MARKDLPNPNASNFLPRVREEIHALLGKLGNAADRALTVREAIDTGVLVPGPGGSLVPGAGSGGAYEPDLTPPPQPGAFTATGAISHFLISQAQPVYSQGHGHNRTVVYGAQWTSGPLPVFANAVELDRFAGTVRAVSSNPATTWRLWIKWESNDGVLSATPAGGTNGVEVTTGQDVALLLDVLAGQISSSELATSLATPIAQIPSISAEASDALTKANQSLASIATMQTELATLSGTPDYDAGTTYALDDIVKYSGGLYRALGTTTGNLPTNTTYWQKVGDYASLGDAVAAHAAQLADHQTRITNAEGDLTAQAGDINQLQADLATTNTAVATKANSSAVSALDARVSSVEGVNTAQGSAITNLQTGLETVNNGLSQKADASALTALSNTVTQQGNDLEAVSNQTTLLTARGSNGGNLIENSEFSLDLSGWTFPSGAGITVGRNFDAYWTVPPGVAYIREVGSNANQSFYYEANPAQVIPVVAGKRYQWSIYTGAHRCLVQAFIYWMDASGAAIGFTPLDGNDEASSGGQHLYGYKRLASFGTAPVGSVSARPILRKTTTKASNSDSFAFFTRAMFCEAHAGQTEPDAYSPGPMVGAIASKAEASALASLSATVTQHGTDISSVSGSVTALQNSLATTNDAVATKASTSYVDAVETRVDAVEGTVSAHGTQISGLSSGLATVVDGLATKANASALTETNTNVSNLAGTVSAQAGQITTIQSSIAAAGNENLYLGPDPLVATSGNYGNAFLLKNGTDNPNKLIPGELLTISADISQDATSAADGAGRVAQIFLWFQSTTEWLGFTTFSSASTTPQRLSATVTLPADVNNMHAVGVGIYHIGGNGAWLGEVRAERIQVERGSVATAYKIGLRNLSASIQTEITTLASQTGELYAQYTVKLDVGGKVSGFGIASTGPTGPGSAFAIRADRFYIAPPASGAGDATDDIIPFVVQATATTDAAGVEIPAGVYMDTAFMRKLVATRGQIGLLAVDDARIASVSVDKLTAGSIAVGQHIQSTGIYPGDGTPNFRVDGAGFAILNQAVVRGIVYASGGEFTGTVRGATIIGGTLTTAESGQRVKIDEQGILFLTGASSGKYGSFKFGAKKYGDGVLVYFNNSVKRVPFYVNSEQDVADIHLYNRASNPPNGEPGDIICVNSRIKTWDGLTGRWRTLAFSD